MSGLLDAAFDGDLATIKRLLADGTARIDEREGGGNSALIVGAAGGQLATVQWLFVSGGSNIRERNNEGLTALIRGAFQGHMAVVQWLLTTGGANITEACNNGFTSLHYAAFGGHTAMTKWLITESGADATSMVNDGRSALIASMGWFQYALAKWLIEEAGANVNQVNAAGHKNVWSALIKSLLQGAVTTDLAALLKVMVLLDDPCRRDRGAVSGACQDRHARPSAPCPAPVVPGAAAGLGRRALLLALCPPAALRWIRRAHAGGHVGGGRVARPGTTSQAGSSGGGCGHACSPSVCAPAPEARLTATFMHMVRKAVCEGSAFGGNL
jgi:hypothetical protein